MLNEFFNAITSTSCIKNVTLPSYALYDANNINEQDIALLTTELLHCNEKKIIARRKKIIAKKEYIASRLLIKLHIAKYLNIPYQDLHLDYDEQATQLKAIYNAKPLALNISLAHSKGIIFFAITKSTVKVGVDIEFQNPHRDTQQLIEAYFHPVEVSALLRSEKSQFYQYWTLKEALAKMANKTVLEVLKQDIRKQLFHYHHATGQYQEFSLSIVQTDPIEVQSLYLVHSDDILQLRHE